MSCDPCLPEISARPALSGPFTVNGTRTMEGDSSTSLGMTSDLSGITSASKASIISLAPVRGRPRRVFSPVNETGSGLS